MSENEQQPRPPAPTPAEQAQEEAMRKKSAAKKGSVRRTGRPY